MKTLALSSSGEAGAVPIVLLIYRRPGLVRTLLQILRKERPQRLWIVADGPSEKGGSEEAAACQSARQEAESGVLWPCEVRKVYAEKNLGLRTRVETGLDAVFAEETQAIVLEDDCHPREEFFPFCRAMLDRYRDDPRVGGISGSCFLPRELPLAADYFFSRYLHIWGWATWARAWNAYERSYWSWPREGFAKFFPEADPAEIRYWNRLFQQVVSGRLSTWDYRWASWFWINGWLSVTPAENLVVNRGFGPDATHTRDATVGVGIERREPLRPPYRGPESVEPDVFLDREIFRNHFRQMEGRLGFFPRMRRSILKRIAWGSKVPRVSP